MTERRLLTAVCLLNGTGQVLALWLEAILIGHILDRVGLAIVSHIGVVAAHSDCLVVGAHVPQLALLIMCFVACIQAASSKMNHSEQERKRNQFSFSFC